MDKELRQAIDAVVTRCALLDSLMDVLGDAYDDDLNAALVDHADVLGLAGDKLQGQVDALRDLIARLADR